MRNRLHFIFSLACVVFTCVVETNSTASAQGQRPVERQNPERIVVNTSEVLLDAVVRDKKGRLIKDLTASDFEVYEDGVKQEISSFRLVSATSVGSSAASTTGGEQGNKRGDQQGKLGDQQRRANGVGTNTTLDSRNVAAVSAVALVFDRLTQDGRARAAQAALNYVQESANSDELFGVFLTDLSVVALQPFTQDRQLVISGIEKAALHSPSLYISNNEETRKQRDQETLSLLKQQMGGVSAVQHGTITTGMLEWLEDMERNEQGDATTRGLLFVASSLRSLPGRKAIVFFSEGMILPPSVMETFRAVIDTANRNNVSFYALDAAGLRAESKTAETVKEMKSRSDARMAQLDTPGGGADLRGLERNEDLLRLNPDSGLGQLADQTGGFLITDSNDLKSKLRKVDEDLHSYYLLSYRSNNQNYDGHFRKIEVKLKRSGLEVQSRKGYFGIKGTFASPVLSYEATALAALANSPKADAFPFYAACYSFPEQERTGLATVLADVPLSAFTFNVDQKKEVYRTDFSVLALLRDQAGQVVDKLSKQYRLSGPLDKLNDDKKGRILFYREVDLSPGRYTLETIAYDALTGRASVRTGTVDVAATDEEKLHLSDVVILSRAEPATAADEKRSTPFRIANIIVSPNLGEPIHRSLKQMPFFVTVYIPTGIRIRPKITVELRKERHTLAEMPGELPEVDASGRIQYLAALPLEKIPAGTYELKVTVDDGTTRVSRSAFFTVED